MRAASIVAALMVAAVVHIPVQAQQAGRPSLTPGAGVGVVSLLSDELHLRYEAPTIFGNRYFTEQVPEWALDEFMARATATILGRLYRYRFEALTVGAVGSTLNPVFVAAEQSGLDTVIVLGLRERPLPDYYEGGYGLLVRKKSWIGKPGIQCAFSWVVIEVWDVDSKDRLDKQEGLTCERDESIEIRDSYADYSGAEKVQFEALVKTSLLRSMEAAASDIEVFRQ